MVKRIVEARRQGQLVAATGVELDVPGSLASDAHFIDEAKTVMAAIGVDLKAVDKWLVRAPRSGGEPSTPDAIENI